MSDNNPVLEEDGFCFACGAENPSGLNLVFSVSGAKACAEFRIPKNLQGYKDIAHGGILALILDEAMIKAASSAGMKAVTADIRVRFRAPLMVGEKAFVEAGIKRFVRRLIYSYAVIKADDSRTIAEAEGRMIIAGQNSVSRSCS